MCTYCRGCRKKVNKIETLIRDIESEKYYNASEVLYQGAHMGFDCCLGSKGVLLDAILDAIKFLNIEEKST
jgi:hypothetical protein